MAELSLTKLAEGRQPARLRMLSCRTLQPFADSEALKNVGLGDLLTRGGIIYGLPATVAEDETLLTVRIKDRYRQESTEEGADALDDEKHGAPDRPRMFKGERVDEWVITWESLDKRLAETVPAKVREESASVGGNAGLYTLIHSLWGRNAPLSSQPPFYVNAEYVSPSFHSKLLLTKTRDVATFTASPAAVVWQISGAPALTLISFANPSPPSKAEKVEREEIRLTAFGRLRSGTFDAVEFERQLWHDISQLLENAR